MNTFKRGDFVRHRTRSVFGQVYEVSKPNPLVDGVQYASVNTYNGMKPVSRTYPFDSLIEISLSELEAWKRKNGTSYPEIFVVPTPLEEQIEMASEEFIQASRGRNAYMHTHEAAAFVAGAEWMQKRLQKP